MNKLFSALAIAAISFVSFSFGPESSTTGNVSDPTTTQTITSCTHHHLTAFHPVQAEGYKTCHLCGGNGICRTCNGKGWFYGNMGTSARLDCPNCTNGLCGRCNGSGQVFTTCD